MYNNNPWVSPSSNRSPPANNPFLENSATNRFPAIDSSQQELQSPSPQAFSSVSSQFHQQPSYDTPQQYTTWNGQSQHSPTYGVFPGYVTPLQQPQPTGGYGSYGQQSPYGGQPQLQYNGYPQYQQPSVSSQQYQQHQQNVISQFDPYGEPNSQQNQNRFQGFPSSGTSSSISQKTGPMGQAHPRQYIQSHKSELESWDSASWKQVLLIFEELKRSWESRRVELQKHLIGGHYLSAEDTANLSGLIRNAESNIDSVVASLIQMQEVHSGYKQSLDATGKRRVREALNAGLQGLPDWP